jgi:hypothetical protein
MKCIIFLNITFLVIITSQNVFSNPQQEIRSDFYYIVNNSDEDLLITVKYKNVIKGWDILGGYHIDYYENGIIVDRIYIPANFQNGDYFLQNHFLPFNNRYIDGVFYWKYKYFFRRLTTETIYTLNRDEFINTFGEENKDQFPPNILFNYRKLSGNDVIKEFIEDIVITDVYGNIIIKLNDFDQNIFEENIVALHIEEYTNDFYNLPRYENIGNEEDYTTMYGIFITNEIIQEGRNKYAENNVD